MGREDLNADPRVRQKADFAAAYGDELAKLGIGLGVVDPDDPFKKVDSSDTPLVALCLSGGGIRSASFALGVLQGLARFDVLHHFHYLSTVSGGGYIGSFLTAWRHHADNDETVFEGLRARHADGQEAPEIAGIRDYSNYLTPKTGTLSADTWTGIAILVRNLVLNWLIFLPFFMGLLLLPRICRDLLEWFAADGGSWAGTLFYCGVGLAVVAFTFASYGRRRSQGRWLTNGRFLLLMVLPLVVAAMCLTAYASTGVLQELQPSYLLGAGWGSGAYLLSTIIASVWLTRGGWGNGRQPAPPEDTIKDLLAWTGAGAIVGALLQLGMVHGPLLMPQNGIYDPRVEPSFLVVLGISWIILCVFAGELMFMGVRSRSSHGDMDREWLARSAGWLAAVAVGWSVFAAISLYGPFIVDAATHEILRWSTLGAAVGSGALSLFLGNSEKTSADPTKGATKWLSPAGVANIAALVFALTLALLLACLDDWVRSWVYLWFPCGGNDLLVSVGGAVLLLTVCVAASIPINVNRFSLHAFYRNRLVRAFLGSARKALYSGKDQAQAREIRDADPFTDFADNDNLRMKDMPTHRLLHVVNVTLNLVATDKLSWQQRKAESFTITPLRCGNPLVGYRPTKDYGSRLGGLTLGSAMAISGAAVSPNMGSNSQPLLGFLMTLFNVRLGWWLGNPRFEKPAREEGPTLGLVPLLFELAGQTTDERDWIYLSDGGHFDNLGLYEMIRRRCRVIVVSDAGADPDCKLTDLGNALRKISIDLGVSIVFRDFDIGKREPAPVDGNYAAVADITYPGSDKRGWLVYIKPGFHGTEPLAIRNYAVEHKDFPHESTAQQWFSESQLESYRALGEHITELLCNRGQPQPPGGGRSSLSTAEFMASVERATGKRA